jgi:hypothetical protein
MSGKNPGEPQWNPPNQSDYDPKIVRVAEVVIFHRMLYAAPFTSCSQCGKQSTLDSPYCPVCGAWLDKYLNPQKESWE